MSTPRPCPLELEATDGTRFPAHHVTRLHLDCAVLRDGSIRVLKHRNSARQLRLWLAEAALFDSLTFKHARASGYVKPEPGLLH